MSASFPGDFAHTVIGGGSFKAQAAVTGATADGVGVDLLLAEGPISCIVDVGVTDFSSLNETYAWRLAESDTSGGTYTDIPGATVSVTATGTSVYITTGQRTKRWVRASLATGGTTPSFLGSAFVFGRKKISGTGAGVQL